MKTYTTPKLTVHGTIEEVTQSVHLSGRLDNVYNQEQVAGVDLISS